LDEALAQEQLVASTVLRTALLVLVYLDLASDGRSLAVASDR
jgi:hypothetical protein